MNSLFLLVYSILFLCLIIVIVFYIFQKSKYLNAKDAFIIGIPFFVVGAYITFFASIFFFLKKVVF